MIHVSGIGFLLRCLLKISVRLLNSLFRSLSAMQEYHLGPEHVGIFSCAIAFLVSSTGPSDLALFFMLNLSCLL